MKSFLVLTAAVFLLATPAAAATWKPTPAAVTHWKSTVLKPANLPAWWKGYLAGSTHLTACKFLTT
jgi:hypothetical protein